MKIGVPIILVLALFFSIGLFGQIGTKVHTSGVINNAGAEMVAARLDGEDSVSSKTTPRVPDCLPLPVPTIAGPDTVCSGTSGYIYITEPGMTGYTWEIPSGGFIASGLGTNSVVVSWSVAGLRTILVNYTNSSGCQALVPTVLNVLVDSSLVAGVTVSASANPLCAGATVTMSAVPVNGGNNPMFQWKRNGINVGTNNITYSYIPANNDQINCEMTSGLTCSTGSPVLSSPVILEVVPNSPTGILITASANPVCMGTNVTYSATPTNGGPNPEYQWKVNGVPAGTGGPTYQYSPENGDLVSCTLISSAECTSGNPALSNIITMTVSPIQMVDITVTPSSNPSCLGSPVTFTAVPTTGGTSPVFQWMVNGNAVGSNSHLYTYTPAHLDIITCRLTSNASCITGNPATSLPVQMTVNQSLPVGITVTGSANPVCQGNTVTYTATPSNPGSAPAFQWSINGFELGPNSPTFSYVPANGDIVGCKLTSADQCATNNPASSNLITMSVSPVMPVNVTISASSNPVCTGMGVILTAQPFNGGATPEFQWMLNGLNIGTNNSSFSYTPTSGDVILCRMTSSATCVSAPTVFSNAVTMTVSNNLQVGVSISSNATQVCQGMTPLFTATPVNGGPNPVYQWKVNGSPAGTNSPYFSYTPANGDVVLCEMNSSVICATGNPAISNSIQMTVTQGQALPVSVSISASANPSCQGSMVTYTAAPENGGTVPSFQWMVNGLIVGSDSPTFSYIPTHGDFISCQLTSNYACTTGNPAQSNQITATVNPNMNVGIGITASANPACLGAIVTYTAIPTNAGTAPVYQWKVNNVNMGTNSSTFSYTPAHNDIITCQLTSSVSCPVQNPVNSNAITMNILAVQPVTISIAASTNPACKNTQVTYSATGTNGGSSPQYLWKLNGTNVGANSQLLIITPLNGDLISCQYTSNSVCVSGPRTVPSNSISMTVSTELIPSVTINPSANPFCAGSGVTFTAAPYNGGTLPVYQWKVNCAAVGTNSPTYSYNPAEGDFVTCRLTSNLICAIRNPATSNGLHMTSAGVNPVSVSITASRTTVCQGTPITFTATPINGGTAPVYQWKVNGINAGTNNPAFTYTPVNGAVVTCQVTSNLACATGNPATSNGITLSVSPTLPVTAEIATRTNPFCEGTTVKLTAVATNGGSNPVYQWRINGVAAGINSPEFTCSPLSGDLITCQLTSNSTCISGANPVVSNGITLSSAPTLTPTVSIAASATTVCQGTPVTLTAATVNGGDIPGWQWKVNGLNSGNNQESFTYLPTNGDQITCTLNSSLSCAGTNPATSVPVSMTVNPLLPVSVTIAASQNPCCQGNFVTFTATGNNGGSAPAYQWQVNCVNVGTNSPTFVYAPQNGDVVVCRFTSSLECVSGNPFLSENINMVVLPVLPVSLTISPSVNPFCNGTNVTFSATCVNEGTNPSYQWIVNNQNVGLSNGTYTYPPLDGDIVKCQLTSSLACVSGNPTLSNELSMEGSSSLAVGVSISESQNPVCSGSFVIFTAVPTNPGAAPTYQWKVNGNNTGPNNKYFQYEPANGDVVTCSLLSSLICGTGNPATSNAITMNVIPQAPVSITVTPSANPSCQGATVNYSATPVNGGTTPAYQWRVNNVNAGTNSPTFSYVPTNGDVVNCRLSSNATCRTGNPANSNNITMVVSPSDPASISISASSNPICQGATVTFTTSTYNGGTAPVFQWKVNGTIAGGNTPTYSYIPANGDVVVCQMTSNSSCITVNTATSNSVTMTVSPIMPVSITVIPSSNPTCVGSVVVYAASAVNPGSSPVYQWKVNGTVAGTNSPVYSYIPSNGDIVTCKLTSNVVCSQNNPATSSPINMTVSQSLAAGITVTPSKNPTCLGETVTFTAAPVNPGPAPVYQWRVNGIHVGTNSLNYSYPPSNGDFITCQLTSSFSCATGNPAMSDPVHMTVSPNVPVSVSISASSNPVCQGTNVTYQATPVNGGTSPAFQWKVNGINMGGNTDNYSFIPVNGDIVTCIMTSNILCPVNNPFTSNAIAMNVLQPAPATIQINPAINPACQGLPVTFTAITTNSGSAPLYQWFVNGNPVGGSQITYTYTPVNGDLVSCRLTTSASCVTSNTVVSNTVTMTVGTDLPVELSIGASANPVCLGQAVTFTALPVNGGMSPTYQWLVNGFTVGTNNPVYTYTPSDGDLVVCQMLSDLACATGNPTTSNAITMSVSQGLPVSISVQPSLNPVCNNTLVFFHANVSNGGTSPTYFWKVNGVNSGPNLPDFSYTPLNGDVITCEYSATAICGSGNTATSSPVTMVVSSVLPVSISIAATANPLCQSTPVTYTASIVNGGAAPVYQWKVNGTTVGPNAPQYTYLPLNEDQVQCLLISSLTCADISPAPSNLITMVVGESMVAGVSISVTPAGTVCHGTPITASAAPTNGGVPVYQWFKNNQPVGTNQPTYSYVPNSGDFLNVVMTSSIACIGGNPATSNTFYLSVSEPLPVSVSITASQNPVCIGMPVTLTAVAGNAGTPVYQWYVNGQAVGSNQPFYTYVPNPGDQVYVTVASSLSCISGNPAVSNVITLTVSNPAVVAVSIVPDHNPVCTGMNITFTATPVNGGTPYYQWFVNNNPVGSNQPLYTYLPAEGDVVHAIMLSDANCITGNPATSNPVTVSISPYVPASVSIAASQNPVCLGSPVTLTASPVNGGTNPQYQWYTNGQPTGTGQPSYNLTPANGDEVHVVMTSGFLCATGSPVTSNSIQIQTQTPLPVSVTVVPDHNPACLGSSVLFTATTLNGGTPAYQWYRNNNLVGTNQPTYAFVPNNGDIVHVNVTSSLSCVSGNPAQSPPVTMLVTPPSTAAVTIAANQNPACDGTPVTLTASPVNGGVPVYQWYKNNQPVGAGLSTYSVVPVNGDEIHVVMTSGLSCITGNPVTSNSVILTVNPVLPASVSITASANPVCQGTPVTFTATPSNGGTPVYQWYKNGTPTGTNQPSFTFQPADGDQVYCSMSSSLPCITGNPAVSATIILTVTQLAPVSVFINASQNPICSGTPVTFTATPVNGGTPAYQWYVNGNTSGSGGPTFTYIPSNGDQVWLVMTSSLSCTTGNPAISNTITLLITPVPGPAGPVSGPSSVCEGDEGISFSVASILNAASYSWQLPPGAILQSGANTSSITVAFPEGAQSGFISVSGTNSCGSGGGSPPFAISVLPAPVAPVVTADGNELTSSVPDGNQWVFEGVEIPGANSQVYTAGEPGWYWTYITVNNCKSDTSNHVRVFGVGMDDRSVIRMNIFPVPNEGRFTLELTLPESENFRVSVISGLGEIVFETQEQFVSGTNRKFFDLPNPSDGVYSILLSNDRQFSVTKIIIHKQ